MPANKRSMIATRLAGRLRRLGYLNYGQYLEHLRHGDGQKEEYAAFIDAVTTHTTHFFRESEHFALLANVLLPDLVKQRGGKPLRIWSAGCSTGEEVYSISMVVHDYLNRVARQTDYQILGTDISRQALAQAVAAIYPMSSADTIPEHFRQAYLLRSRHDGSARIRIAPELRNRTRFSLFNLVGTNWHLAEPMDLIFCRNVLIYFERPAQLQMIRRLSDALANHGYLVLGHSEGAAGNLAQLVSHGRSVYEQRRDWPALLQQGAK